MKSNLIVNDPLADRKTKFFLDIPHCTRSRQCKPWEPLPSPYPLQIEAVPIEERVRPDLLCRLVHRSTGYRVPGSFTTAEAGEILDRSSDWDWSIDEKRRPACARQLLALLQEIAGIDSGDRAERSIGEVGNV